MKALLALLFVGCVGLSHSMIEYDLSEFCGKTVPIYVFTAAKLKTSSYQSNVDCVVSVYSWLHEQFPENNNKLRLEVRSMNMPCESSYMDIYDGSRYSGTKLDRITCVLHKTFYVTNSNYMTLVIHSDDQSITAINLLATATSKDYEGGDFLCSNGYTIDSSLECDGYNNCEDESDETTVLCLETFKVRYVIIITVACVSGSVFALIVVLVVHRCRRRNAQYQVLVNPTVQQDYGTIQGGANLRR